MCKNVAMQVLVFNVLDIRISLIYIIKYVAMHGA